MTAGTRMGMDPRSSRKGAELAEWRVLRGWTDAELHERLRRVAGYERNFEERDAVEMTAARGWHEYGSTATIAREAAGPPEPDGCFERGCEAIFNYRFSDPGIVECHFDADAPLEGRRMLLEIKVLGLRYLCGVVVGAARDERTDGLSACGFRYDTLRGHVEAGSEWFVLTKDHTTGEITFRVHARWRAGDFPNWWSRLGFRLVVQRYQRRWHRRAHARMQYLAHTPVAGPRGVAGRRRIAHEGPPVDFHYGELEAATEWEWQMRD